MKTLYRIINNALNDSGVNSTAAVQVAVAQGGSARSSLCNYADNYYGDQMCNPQQ
jgi:hypothetical protein